MESFTESAFSLPSLGQNVQLGELCDIRTGTLYSGVSLWPNSLINVEVLPNERIQNAEFEYAYSLDEARKKVGLNVEGSLSLDLNLLKVEGSAKYLNNKKTSTYEARIDVSCTIVRRTRRIPQEILASMQYEGRLSNPRFTHFVAEVVEGATACLSFVYSCESLEEQKKVEGHLKVLVVGIPISGEAQVGYESNNYVNFDRLKISYSGAIAENVTKFEDAIRVAREMPTKLLNQMNTLSYKLLPLSVLNSSARRLIHELDATLIHSISKILASGEAMLIKLTELEKVLCPDFPNIIQQVRSFNERFHEVETAFRESARRLLPILRDGNSDVQVSTTDLFRSKEVFEKNIRTAELFHEKKRKESMILRETLSLLFREGFQNRLSGGVGPLVDTQRKSLLLSFGGPILNIVEHPLQKDLLNNHRNDNDDEQEEDDEEDIEWFENPHAIASVRSGTAALRQLRSRLIASRKEELVSFGIVNVEKALRPGGTKKSKTNVGDIILEYGGKLLVVTGCLPEIHAIPEVNIVDGQNIEVRWHYLLDSVAPLPPTSFCVRYRPVPNPGKDGIYSKIGENEIYNEIKVDLILSGDYLVKIENLLDDCDYEIEICMETTVGPSEWSKRVLIRTVKKPSVASQLIQFYDQNSAQLSQQDSDVRPWLRTADKKTLYLGHRIVAERLCDEHPFAGKLAVVIVDVASEYHPELQPHHIDDDENTKLVVFAGCSGHGKSTQINAFVSFLLGGDLNDAARIMVIDDSAANQARSVTQYVTCYRVRPLSPHFGGKTLVIVDTPGYGDTDGVQKDRFVTAVMSMFFKTVKHINTIVFTCRANESRTTILSPVSNYVFSLFAKNVSSCLRTVYTFSDVGVPLARRALQELQWPVENGEVEVNNAAFSVSLPDSKDLSSLQKLQDWWRMSANGQYQILNMILRMSAVSTDASAQVTTDRMELERKCELAEKKILRTANEAQQLISNLGALAQAVGAAPQEKVAVKLTDAVEEPVQSGKATTLCISCSFTCHEVCSYGDDQDKIHCCAMDGEYCRECPGRCHWSKHRNAKFIIRSKERIDYVVPEELIKHWNKKSNSLEGALLDAIGAYLKLQEELRDDMTYLARLTGKLQNTALLHDPGALINYVETLIMTARARGAPSEQLMQLTTALNTLKLAAKVTAGGASSATRDSQLLLDVLGKVQKEMSYRMKLDHKERVAAEAEGCSLYNDLHETLPRNIKEKAPELLPKRGIWPFTRDPLYPDNLTAIVTLVKVVLTDGEIVAAIATSAKV